MAGKVYIIAEAGVNHNGSVALAKKMISVASIAGVNAIKFQTFMTEDLVTKAAMKADYQLQTTRKCESQYEMLKKLEIPLDAYAELLACCKEHNIDFLSTPFDEKSLDFLVEQCKIGTVKVPSGEINNAPFLLKIARTGKKVILSTGMSTLGEIELALGVLAFGYLNIGMSPSVIAFQQAYSLPDAQKILREKVVLLHCTSEYPADLDAVNLRFLDTLASTFALPVGYSDHTEGITIAMAAVARGAIVIEKHFTLDRSLAGPDHKASLEPQQLSLLVEGVRSVEQSMGSGIKIIGEAEWKNRLVVRKSLVAARKIAKGEVFTTDNLVVKRPAGGMEPFLYWDILGKKANQEYQADEQINEYR